MSFKRNGLTVAFVLTALLATFGHTAAAAPKTGTGPATVSLAPALKDRLAARAPISGAKLKRSDLDGRVVVVTFFASWCPPCNIEFRHLAKLHKAYTGRGLTIVAINHFEDYAGFQDNGARLARFVARHDPPFFVVRGSDGIARAFGNVTRIPTLFVFSPKGDRVFRFVHEAGARKTNATMAEVRAAIDAAFDSAAPNRSGRDLPPVRQSAVTKP